jgi:hypothetical protein
VPAAQAAAFKHRYVAVRQICFQSRYSDLVSLVRGVFAFRHHQMMRLMMSALHHDPHEAQSLGSLVMTVSFTPFGRFSVLAFQRSLTSSATCAQEPFV